MEFKHYSVMLAETVDALCVKNGGIYADGTLGGGGHSYEILKRADDVRLVGIDQDTDALCAAKKRLESFGNRVTYVNDNFRNINYILDSLGLDEIDGMVLDLGVSSYQLDNAERGFSYMQDAPLDMRMNKSGAMSAYDVVNGYSEDELTDIFYRYGEENWSRRIAKFIVDKRKIKSVETTGELAEIIRAAIPQAARKDVAHPEKRVFQAIRIEVNGELEILKTAVCDIVGRLKKGGRLAVITFHSLEDRIVKQAFSELAKGCTCPADFPVCVCGKKPEIKIITKKPVLPKAAELEENSRSKSAKLRVAQKL
ncbi:MAG: 16S rRNA (cytosine(1402)-N(4))-methyltransferase RsmH [Clostridia bacterium]|nr:16S rRNA (cytosine(1402)-N(4))-methyltransferase RsmH [Clostridia bacterium]